MNNFVSLHFVGMRIKWQKQGKKLYFDVLGILKRFKVANHHLKARISTKSVKKLKISLAQFIVLFDP